MSDENPQRAGNLEGPLMIIAKGPSELFVVRVGDENDPMADCQMYELDVPGMMAQIKPLGVWLKFMYNVDGVVPPVPFTEDEAERHVMIYEALKRARAAAAADDADEA